MAQSYSAGTESDSLIGLIDFAKTVADITDISTSSDEVPDSFSILPILLNPHATARNFIINHSVTGMFAIRSHDWKLIDGLGSGGFSRPVTYNPERPGENGQLYSMKDDYWEQVNFYLKEQKKVKEML